MSEHAPQRTPDPRPFLYLACPYSDPDPAVRLARFEAVTREAGLLTSEGYIVFSPITHYHPIALLTDLPTDWEFWRSIDIAHLSHSYALAVLCLPGWEESIGVQAEIRIARDLGIPVSYIGPEARKCATSNH